MASKAKGISFGLVVLVVFAWALLSKKPSSSPTPAQALTLIPGVGGVIAGALAPDAAAASSSSSGSSPATSISGQTGVYGLDWY